MGTALLEEFEMVAQAQQLLPRLDAAVVELATRERLVEEKAWLATARSRLAGACSEIKADLLVRVLRLPELESIKGDHARTLQGAAVDALEHLHAAITFAGGPRAPLLEALYYKLKIIPLRKVDRDEFEAFCTDFEKRLSSGYAKRMLADETYAPVGDALKGLRRAVETWRSIFIAPPAEEAEAAPLREELEVAAKRCEIAARQARLLAQAALAPLKESVDAAALLALKARKRGRGADDEDTHAVLEQDPPDPRDPTEEEREELARQRGE